MWLVVLFDLPVDTREARGNYARFRTLLRKNGFDRLQFSVYARFFVGEEAAEVHRRRVKASLPPHGQVRLLAITDHQFGRMETFIGKKQYETEKPPEQLLLF